MCVNGRELIEELIFEGFHEGDFQGSSSFKYTCDVDTMVRSPNTGSIYCCSWNFRDSCEANEGLTDMAMWADEIESYKLSVTPPENKQVSVDYPACNSDTATSCASLILSRTQTVGFDEGEVSLSFFLNDECDVFSVNGLSSSSSASFLFREEVVDDPNDSSETLVERIDDGNHGDNRVDSILMCTRGFWYKELIFELYTGLSFTGSKL